MTVICENCQTANRDKAKFCIGCAGKLPAFSATGPAAVASPEHMRSQRQRDASARGATWPHGNGRNGMRWWFAAVLLIGALATLVGWMALAPGRTAVPTASLAAQGAPTASGVTPAPAMTASSTVAPTGPVPFEAALAPGETAVASDPKRTSPIDGTPDASPAAEVNADADAEAAPAPAPRASPAPRSSTPRITGNGRADPRVGCEHLFFAFAARCEANHCAEAAYARHPRCDVVRAQRQRDDARRNMTSGY